MCTYLVTALPAFSILAFVFCRQGRECIICHETSRAIVVCLFSNLEKLSHSSTFFPHLNPELLILLLFGSSICGFFFLIFSFILPAFTALKILLRAIDKMWHITFCALHYFLLQSKRGTDLSKIKGCWMLRWICKMRTVRYSRGPEGLSKCPSQWLHQGVQRTNNVTALKGNCSFKSPPMCRNNISTIIDVPQ